METHKLLYSRREAAQMISVSIREIDKLIASSQLAAIRIGRRVLVARNALERFARIGNRLQREAFVYWTKRHLQNTALLPTSHDG
jgi:excisionase family DNA binding protein